MRELPHGWRLLTLADVARWGSGGTPSAGRSDYYGGDVPWAVIGDLTDGPVSETKSTITGRGLAESSAKLVPPGTLLVAMYGSIGKLGIAQVEMATNQAIAFAITNDHVTTEYLFYYLLSQRDDLATAGKGAAQKNISQGLLKSWLIPVPPIDEQRRIVGFLEDHLSRLDAADDYLGAASMRLRVMRTSALQQMTTHLTNEGTRALRIGEVGTSALGKMLDAKRANGTPTPYLRNINVRWGHFDLSDVSTVQLTDVERTRFALRDGDVLVCEGGEPGRCAVWRGNGGLMAYQKALHRIRVKPDLIAPEYLALCIEAFIRSGRGDRLFTGTTIKHLPQERLREITIPVPPLVVQMEVISRLADLEGPRIQMTDHLDRTSRRSQALRRALLAAAFSGRLTGHISDLDLAEEIAFA